jgi:Ca-activated chloride channel family protein
MQYAFLPTWRQARRVQREAIAICWIVLACASFTSPAYSQASIGPRVQLDAKASRSAVIRANVHQVFIPTTVTDSFGRPIQGLRKQDFRVLEDGVEQDLSNFFVDDGPISIGIILDVSGSVKNKLAEARQAVSEFLRLSSPQDEFFLITFKDQPELVRGFTTKVDDIESDLMAVQPSGWTALYDAMVMGIHHMKRANWNRRVLLVLSDGGDNNSRYTEAEVKNLVREANVRIFSISMQSHTPALDKLAADSGGHGYRVPKLEELPEAAATLSAEAHAEYVLGFTPPERPQDGKYHVVKVEVPQRPGEPRVHVSWRHGYYGLLQ